MIEENIYSIWSLSRIHSEWSVILSQEFRLTDPAFRSEATHFARVVMRKAKHLFEQLASRLVDDGYTFVVGNWPIKNPEPDAGEWISDLRDQGIYIPIVLEAWLTEVGVVNLCGSHPDWSRPAYAFDDKVFTSDLLLTDAFVCELNREYIQYLCDERKSEDLTNQKPFRIDFSPDHLHKANISGGLPYEISVDSPTIDSIVFNERHCTSFMGLVRNALKWRGFSGFEYIAGEGIWSTKGPQVL
jgi:hypothetical protein